MGTVEVFESTKEWKGEPIRKMGDEHLANLVKWLNRNVEGLRTAYGLELFAGPLQPSGDMANDAFDAAMAEDAQQSDVEWLHSTPLYRALKREIIRRDPTLTATRGRPRRAKEPT